MAITGTKGSVKVGLNEMGCVQSWTIEKSTDALDITCMQAAPENYREFMPSGLINWSGSFTLQGDTEVELSTDELANLELMNEKRTYSGDAVITSVSEPVTIGEVVIRTVNFQGSGELTEAATT